ncbi:MAG: hypothetical protein M3O36_10205, partial [Myxococcota bacterium]|nr:hypothetical protein [Myxococcota bacterium]
PVHWAHAPAAPLAFDLPAARTLLRQAAPTTRLRLTILSSTERLRVAVARFIAQELGDAGVDAAVVPLELGTMIARLDAGDFDLAILQLPEMTEPNVLSYFLHGAFVPPTGANRGRVHDAELDALLDLGSAVMDPEARRAIYARMEAREREEMHVVPLWYEDQVVVTSARARAFAPSAEGRWLDLANLR